MHLITKSVNILTAIQWIRLALDIVTSQTIENYFKHCGAIEMPEEGEEDHLHILKMHSLKKDFQMSYR